MKSIWIIAKHTYKEIIRQRLLYGVFLVAALLTGASFFLATISLDQNERVLQNVGLMSIHILTLFICTFVCTNSMSHDVDRRALYFLFPKPVNRTEYVLGKFLGFTLFLTTTLGILGGIFSIGVAFLDPHILPVAGINLLYSLLELSLLLGVAELFASFTAPLNASLYTLALYAIGHSQTSLKMFVADLHNIFLNRVIDAVYYLLPNLEKFDVHKATLYQGPIPASSLPWAIGYWVLYVVIVLYLTVQVVTKREF